ncbi:uncharacterized protein CYBJADRAFT_63147 [Cyberlindnera jadinii NRRL Y-1542]|uniref:Uncharacterized protein n=1 Tax=Cyberlindnera jadinii (strain ATCC 18201 / CBS 1600 / BCRC 20928 / JCM 3617 / NBRC 0987 / NRRL Y-1542) TaxID=983966 RepID=A0A1E4S621_CYBJN|nr:hypothetical protein CYBJADRAFT_63147 [Cyberlindnera jadinii NRRL Y-1542]ODV74832.1 hypothetical protein CYBJADRAFT_63147 [Cyberlindnera jadinii NRRL Y-1542]
MEDSESLASSDLKSVVYTSAQDLRRRTVDEPRHRQPPSILVTKETPTDEYDDQDVLEEPQRYYTTDNTVTPYRTMDTFTTSISRNPFTLTNEESIMNRTQTSDDNTTPPNRLVDKVPRARHTVDYQDMLWTQIDILDDVRKMSTETREQGGFFSREHSVAMSSLRDSQSALLKELKLSDAAMDKSDVHRSLWDSESLDEVKGKLYNREQFDKVRESLGGVKLGLEGVSGTMRRFDRRGKE